MTDIKKTNINNNELPSILTDELPFMLIHTGPGGCGNIFCYFKDQIQHGEELINKAVKLDGSLFEENKPFVCSSCGKEHHLTSNWNFFKNNINKMLFPTALLNPKNKNFEKLDDAFHKIFLSNVSKDTIKVLVKNKKKEVQQAIKISSNNSYNQQYVSTEGDSVEFALNGGKQKLVIAIVDIESDDNLDSVKGLAETNPDNNISDDTDSTS